MAVNGRSATISLVLIRLPLYQQNLPVTRNRLQYQLVPHGRHQLFLNEISTWLEGPAFRMNRDQKKDLIEGLGLLAIVASLMFLALEIRQNTVQAQAAAIQALGIATSEWFLSLDDRENRLLTEASYPEALERLG